MTTKQYAFVFTEIIFVIIYTQAAIIFTHKRNEYRRRDSLNKHENERLQSTIDQLADIQSQIQEYRGSLNDDYHMEIRRLQKQMYNILTDSKADN